MLESLDILLPLIIAVVIFIAVFLLIALFSNQIEKQVDPLLGNYLTLLEQEFSILEIPITAKRFMLFQIGFASLLFVVGLLLGGDILMKFVLGALLALIGVFLSKRYILIMKQKRKLKH